MQSMWSSIYHVESLNSAPSVGIKLPEMEDDEGLWIDDNTAAFSHRWRGVPVIPSVVQQNGNQDGGAMDLDDLADSSAGIVVSEEFLESCKKIR